MNEKVLRKIINELSQRKPIFHSEAELQFELAYEIRKQVEGVEVWVEYPATKLKGVLPNSSINTAPRIDLVIVYDNKWYPIELKYITGKFESYNYALTDGNKMCKAYYYVKDIKRLEEFSDKYIGDFAEGYTIILSNNSDWYQTSKPIDNSIYIYGSFYLEDNSSNKLNGKIRFKNSSNPKCNKKDKKEHFELRGSYSTKWQHYANVFDQDGKKHNFKFIINRVE